MLLVQAQEVVSEVELILLKSSNSIAVSVELGSVLLNSSYLSFIACRHINAEHSYYVVSIGDATIVFLDLIAVESTLISHSIDLSHALKEVNVDVRNTTSDNLVGIFDLDTAVICRRLPKLHVIEVVTNLDLSALANGCIVNKLDYYCMSTVLLPKDFVCELYGHFYEKLLSTLSTGFEVSLTLFGSDFTLEQQGIITKLAHLAREHQYSAEDAAEAAKTILRLKEKKTDKEIGELSGAELAEYIEKMRRAKK